MRRWPAMTVAPTLTASRRLMLPAPVLPLAYFAGAHAALLAGCLLLASAPSLAGAFHYHPRMIALTHVVTLGWVTASILGALYIVGPLALGVPMPVGRADIAMAVAFWTGAAGMVWGFWTGGYPFVGVSALLVLTALAWVGARVVRGLVQTRVPWAVTVHIALAFVNILGAGGLGIYMALTRAGGGVVSPLAMAAAHAHLATVGWAVMMIVGVAYRLVPMFLPAAMPTGASLVWSAVLLEAGALGTAWGLAMGRDITWAGLCVAGGFTCFGMQIRATLRNRRPRPAAMQGRDWSTWQTHVALHCLPVAIGIGLWLAWQPAPSAWTWVYGVIGLIGFVSQMVVSIQGRLLPMHAWYVAMSRLHGGQPGRSVHELYEAPFARVIFLLWLAGVPALAAGLARQTPALISIAGLTLALALVVQTVYGVRMVVRASRATPVATS
jgi:hypothetical protein